MPSIIQVSVYSKLIFNDLSEKVTKFFLKKIHVYFFTQIGSFFYRKRYTIFV